MSWHLLGAGSLGSLWAARLSAAGYSVELILRNEQRLADYLRAGGLQVRQGEQTLRHALPAGLAGDPLPIRRLLLACKAYDAADAIASVAPRLLPGSPSQVWPRPAKTTRKSSSRKAPSVLEANRQRARGRRLATAS